MGRGRLLLHQGYDAYDPQAGEAGDTAIHEYGTDEVSVFMGGMVRKLEGRARFIRFAGTEHGRREGGLVGRIGAVLAFDGDGIVVLIGTAGLA